MSIKNRSILLLILISVFSAGCTYTSKGKAILPQEGETMADIYKDHMNELGIDNELKPHYNVIVDERAMYDTYADDARNELEQLFPVLPNPTLVIYVHPHLAGEEFAPVPGYYTSVPLYEHTYYALPGEVKPRSKY